MTAACANFVHEICLPMLLTWSFVECVLPCCFAAVSCFCVGLLWCMCGVVGLSSYVFDELRSGCMLVSGCVSDWNEKAVGRELLDGVWVVRTGWTEHAMSV